MTDFSQADDRPVLQADGLDCERRGRAVFGGVALRVPAGGVLQVCGDNGAGKTSLLRILVGLLRPAAGRVWWEGQSLAEARDTLHTRLLYLGHTDALKPLLTAAENLRFLVPSATRAAIDRALERVGLAGCADRPVGTLSAGQRRRAALARLFVTDRPWWVLDEPLTALDSASRDWMLEALRAHADNGGLVLFTAHHDVDLGTAHQRLMLGGGA